MKKSSALLITTCGIFTALLCIFAPISVPIGPIPISLSGLVLYFAIYVIGMKKSLISYVVYLLLGLVGLPVFSGYQGGLAKIAGPTGGYLVGYIFVIVIGGIVYEKVDGKAKIPAAIVAMMVGTVVCYAFGTAWFVFQMDCELSYALGVCVYPFIPFDCGKIAIATLLGVPVRKALVKQGLVD